MSKQSVFILVFILLLGGCGQESKIKTHVKAEKLACMYGDCKHVIRNVTFPLDNSALAFNTPLPGLGPIAGGMLRLIGDIFAKHTKKGSLDMSYTLPLPEVPEDILHSVRLTRFFFYMKPKAKRRKISDWFHRYVLGSRDDTFKFLDKLAVRLSTTDLDNPKTYVPELMNNLDNKDELEKLMSVFEGTYREKMIDTEIARDVILLKYDRANKDFDTSNEFYGKIHYLETSLEPALVKNFFQKNEEFKGHYKRILILEQSLLIELEKDPISDEIFKQVMIENAKTIERLGVYFIDTCTINSCLEINVPDINLLPIAEKGNAIKLDAIMRAGSVPDSFKLKGFVEFEVKIDPKI